MIHVAAAEQAGEYRVHLRFSDRAEGEVDLSEDLHGPVFEPLRDSATFGRVRLHPELGTIVWPNGADFAPEFLRERLRSAAGA